MKKVYASFKHGKIFSKRVDIIILIFSAILLGLITWLIIGVIKGQKELYVLYGVVLLLLVETACLWLLIRDFILKRKISVWMQDAIKVYAFVELENKPSLFGQMVELRADIFWKESHNKKRKIVLRTVLKTALYKKIINKNSNAFYSQKYQQLIFYEE